MVSPMTLGFILAAVAGLIALLAERLHLRRTQRVAYLAFGPSGKPARWASATPTVRVISVMLVSWGLGVLFLQEPQFAETEPNPEASKHVLICLDSSPSMFVKDAGPNRNEPISRMVRAGQVVQAILDRMDDQETRTTVFAVYTKALPVAEETFDKNVVRNLFDGLPMYAAFEQGSTHLQEGVTTALEYARKWPKDSATLIVISDGDSSDKKAIRGLPQSIADSIVIGVGDSKRSTRVSGHASKQDASSLRSLSSQLHGLYFDGNTKHLPSDILANLQVIKPRIKDFIDLRDVAVVATATGTILLALLGPMLSLLGMRLDHPRRHPIIARLLNGIGLSKTIPYRAVASESIRSTQRRNER